MASDENEVNSTNLECSARSHSSFISRPASSRPQQIAMRRIQGLSPAGAGREYLFRNEDW